MAGVIAALEDNQIGIAGVAPGARLMALRACWQQDPSATVCDTLSLAKAVHYAVDHSAQVINLGSGSGITIGETAKRVLKIMGRSAKLSHDSKILDVSSNGGRSGRSCRRGKAVAP